MTTNTIRKIKEPVGSYWLDDGAASGVWPVKVHSISVFGVTVEGTHEHGPYFGETLTVAVSRVYDSAFNRPTYEATA